MKKMQKILISLLLVAGLAALPAAQSLAASYNASAGSAVLYPGDVLTGIEEGSVVRMDGTEISVSGGSWTNTSGSAYAMTKGDGVISLSKVETQEEEIEEAAEDLKAEEAVSATEGEAVPEGEEDFEAYAEPAGEEGYEEPAAEEGYEEPAAEEGYEEPAAEEGYEEPVAEEGYEEIAVEEMYEEPAGEEVYEEPAAEEEYEEPVIEEAYEEPAGEEEYEEPAAEEEYEEPAGEEGYEEPVAEEAYEEPVMEEVYEEPAAEEAYEEPASWEEAEEESQEAEPESKSESEEEEPEWLAVEDLTEEESETESETESEEEESEWLAVEALAEQESETESETESEEEEPEWLVVEDLTEEESETESETESEEEELNWLAVEALEEEESEVESETESEEEEPEWLALAELTEGESESESEFEEEIESEWEEEIDWLALTGLTEGGRESESEEEESEWDFVADLMQDEEETGTVITGIVNGELQVPLSYDEDEEDFFFTVSGTAPENGIYLFTGWTAEDEDGKEIPLTGDTEEETDATLVFSGEIGDAKITVTANYERAYELFIAGGNVTGGETLYLPGDEVSVTVAAELDEGHEFLYWKLSTDPDLDGDFIETVKEFNCTDNPIALTFTMPDANVILTAILEETDTEQTQQTEQTEQSEKRGESENPVQILYRVTVENGWANQEEYHAGDTVIVTSNYPDTDQEFSRWTSADPDVVFSNDTRAATSFIMPEKNVTVAATYKEGPYSYIEGIEEGATYAAEEKLTFTPIGGGMDNTDPNPGDIRYVPTSYQIGNVSNTWSSAPYTTSMSIKKSGEYTLSVDFTKQIWNGTAWEDAGETTQASVTFYIASESGTVSGSYGSGGESGNAGGVATGDSTPLLVVEIIVVIAAIVLVVGLIIFYYRRRLNNR